MAERPVRTFIDDADVIAERELEIVDRAGKAGKLHVRIAKPMLLSEGEWGCGVHLAEVEKRVTEVYGADSMQALTHALFLVPVALGELKRRGVVLTCDGDENLHFPEFSLTESTRE